MSIICKFSIASLFHSVIAFVLAGLIILFTGCIIETPVSVTELNKTPEELAQEVVELTNAKRVANGLPPLKSQSTLSNAALWMAKDMADHNYFSHKDRLGRGSSDRCQAFGYESYYVGENIGAGYTSSTEAVSGWMNSEGHRENILEKTYREIGVGYGFNSDSKYGHYWVQNFGTRFEIYPIVINNEQDTTSNPFVNLYIYGTDWAEYMRLSNDSTNWTDWQSPKANSKWMLEESTGQRIVYLELRKGDEIRTSNDSIYLNPKYKHIRKL